MKWDMPIRSIESGPLTGREIRELHGFLLAEDGLEHPMDFYTFDGFICAVLSGPNTIMPWEWLRWIWDQERGAQARCRQQSTWNFLHEVISTVRLSN